MTFFLKNLKSHLMIFLFIWNSVSSFIPFSSTRNSLVPTVDLSHISSTKTNFKKIYVGFKDGEDDNFIRSISILNAAKIYQNKIKFYFLNDADASELANRNNVQLPALFLYEGRRFVSSCPYPDSDSAALHFYKLFANDVPKTCMNPGDLFPRIGNSPFTIICSPQSYMKARKLCLSASSQMGSMGLIPVTKNVFSYLGFKDDSLLLFRTEDSLFVEITYNIEELYSKSYPSFRYLMDSDLRGEGVVIFALIAPALTNEYSDFLYEVGINNEHFTVGYLPKNLHPYAQMVCRKEFTDKTVDIVIFSYDGGFYYPTSSEFNESFFRRPFDITSWVSKSNRLLSKIEDGTIQYEFITEEEPPISDDNLQKLVGTTYADFVNDSEHDVVILYKRDNCEHCDKFFPIFRDFSNNCTNITTVKFGWIDIIKNAARTPYPYMPGVPHVELFPAKGKSESVPIKGGHSSTALERLLKDEGSFEYPFNPPPLEKGAVAMEVLQLLFTIKDLPPSEQARAMKYIEALNEYANVTDESSARGESGASNGDITAEL